MPDSKQLQEVINHLRKAKVKFYNEHSTIMVRKIPGGRGGTIHLLEKGETANPNGRPKKLVSHFNAELKKEGYEPLTQSQLLDAFNLIFNLDSDKLRDLQKKIKAGENMPFIYALLLKQLNSNKGLEALEKMLDRAYGKATQKVEQKQEATVSIINSEDQKILDEVLNNNIGTD